MPYKPMEPHLYHKYLAAVKWKLKKGAIDWNLYDENEIAHSKGKKQEIVAFSVRKTEQEFKERGLKWPPRKMK